MGNSRFFYVMRAHVRQKRVFYLVHLFLLVVGISCGIVTAVRLAPALALPSSESVHAAIQGFLLRMPFEWRGLLIAVWYALLDYVIVAFLPAAWLLMLFKGFFIGFSGGYLVLQFGLPGILVMLAGVLPMRVILCGLLLNTASEAPWKNHNIFAVARRFIIAGAVSVLMAIWLPFLAGVLT